MTLKSACVTLIAIVAITAPIFAVWAATPSHFIGIDSKPPHPIPVDLDASSLVVHLNADGSLVVSQRHKAGNTPITLPSLQALPAEIDALVPRRGERKTIVIAADSTAPYRNLLNLMNEASDGVGFGEVGILGPEKEPGGAPSELGIRVGQGNPKFVPGNNSVFVSLGADGIVIVKLGLGADAKGVRVNAAGAVDAAANLVPKGRAGKELFFRADFEVLVGNAFELLRKLRAIGFTNIGIVAEATGDSL